nr:hypothetical protein [Microvirga sp. VF16]
MTDWLSSAKSALGSVARSSKSIAYSNRRKPNHSEGPVRVDAVEELGCVETMGMIPLSSGFAGRRIDDRASAERPSAALLFFHLEERIPAGHLLRKIDVFVTPGAGWHPS